MSPLFLIAACRTGGEVTDKPETGADTVELHFSKADAPAFYKESTGTEGMVVSAHPLASQAGKKILKSGGNAIDAAVAAAFAVAVLEPSMSGLGGSGAMVIWNRKQQMADYLDYYAATGTDPDYALDTDPDSLITRERQVAVPGMVAGLLESLEKYGSLERKTVMEPAIKLAEEGFILHPLLAHIIAGYPERLTYDKEAAAIFYPDGEPLRAGAYLIQTELADVLRKIANYGLQGFYTGEVAERAIEKLSEGNSTLTVSDFENYRPKWRGALCREWEEHRILTAPPSLAGHEIILALNLISSNNITGKGHPVSSGEALSVMVEALRIARADRLMWDGDPSHVDLPVAGMISEEYAAQRNSAMGGTVPDTMRAGDPWSATQHYTPSPGCTGQGFFPLPTDIIRRDGEDLRQHIPEPFKGRDGSEQEQHTTHIAVVDRNGNAVSMTNTLGLYFGSAVYSDGVFYNSAANNYGDSYGDIRGPRRSAHSSTAPTIVLSGDRAALVTGSPGSGRIPPAIVNTIVHSLLYHLHPAEAIRMPRIFPMINNRRVQLERGFAPEAIHTLHERGYIIDPSNYPMDMTFGGVQMIRVLEDGTMIGVSDPRREGGTAGW